MTRLKRTAEEPRGASAVRLNSRSANSKPAIMKSSAKVDNPICQKIDHPICHLMNGRRLYYLLITFNAYETTVKDEINRILTESGLGDSSCGYLIYGPADLLVRVWATAEELNKLIDGLGAITGIDPVVKIHLIDDISTWAQRELEGMESWSFDVVHSHMERILEAKIPPQLTRKISSEHVLFVEDNVPEAKVRVFLFSEARYTTHADFFYQVCDLVTKKISERRLDHLQFISLYSYTTSDARSDSRGVIIKATIEATQFALGSLEIVELSRDIREQHGVGTNTFISARAIKSDGDKVIIHSEMSKDVRSREITYNLLKTPDCLLHYYESSRRQACLPKEAARRANQFIIIFSQDILGSVFFYHMSWWRRMSECRLFYRWIAQGDSKQEQMVAVMMRGYAEIEKRIRVLLENTEDAQKLRDEAVADIRKQVNFDKAKLEAEHLETIMKRLKKSMRLEPELTLSRLQRILPELRSSSYDNTILTEFRNALPSAIKSRNKLMHGDEHAMTTISKDKKWIWEAHVPHYLRLWLLLPEVERILSENISNVEPNPHKDEEGAAPRI